MGFFFQATGMQTDVLCTNLDNLIMMAVYCLIAIYFNPVFKIKKCHTASSRFLSYTNCFLFFFTIIAGVPIMQSVANFGISLLIIGFEFKKSLIEQDKLLQGEAATQTSELGPDFEEVSVA